MQRRGVHVDVLGRHEPVLVHEPDAVVVGRAPHAGVRRHRHAELARDLERRLLRELRVAGDVERHLEAEHVAAAAEAPVDEALEVGATSTTPTGPAAGCRRRGRSGRAPPPARRRRRPRGRSSAGRATSRRSSSRRRRATRSPTAGCRRGCPAAGRSCPTRGREDEVLRQRPVGAVAAQRGLPHVPVRVDHARHDDAVRRRRSRTSPPGPPARARRPRCARRRRGRRRPARTSCASSIVSTVPRRRTIGRPGSGVEASVLMLGSFPGRVTGRGPVFGPPAAWRWRSHAVGDVVERDAVDVDGDVAAGGVLGQAQVAPRAGGRAAGGRREKPRTSSETERMSGAGSVISAPAMFPTSTWRAPRAAACMAASAGAPHSMSIVTSTAPPRGLADPLGRGRRRVDLHDGVRAALEEPRAGARRAVGGDDAAGAEQLRRPARRRCRPRRSRRARAPSRPAAGRRATPARATPPRPVLPSAAATSSSTPSATSSSASCGTSVRSAIEPYGGTRRVEVDAPAVLEAADAVRSDHATAAAAGPCRRCRTPCAGRGGAGPRRRPRPRRSRARRCGSSKSSDPRRGAVLVEDGCAHGAQSSWFDATVRNALRVDGVGSRRVLRRWRCDAARWSGRRRGAAPPPCARRAAARARGSEPSRRRAPRRGRARRSRRWPRRAPPAGADGSGGHGGGAGWSCSIAGSWLQHRRRRCAGVGSSLSGS